MSEAEYYWLGVDDRGWFSVTHGDGVVRHLWWNGSKWSEGQFDPWQLTTEKVKERGYLGVRRETPAKQDLTALVREAIDDFRRNVKQPTKAADWAFKWANRFIEAVGS